jgi:hypothetical protein
MTEYEVANFHVQTSDVYAYAWMVQDSFEVFHENKLPYICSMYDTGFKVLSM